MRFSLTNRLLFADFDPLALGGGAGPKWRRAPWLFETVKILAR
jgi:hypothetical protein